jgi:hypothetical protein
MIPNDFLEAIDTMIKKEESHLAFLKEQQRNPNLEINIRDLVSNSESHLACLTVRYSQYLRYNEKQKN